MAKCSSGLSTEQRTILAQVERILPDLEGRWGDRYTRVLWRIYDADADEYVTGYTDCVHSFRNYRLWEPWLRSAERASIWAVVVADDLNRSEKMICIDADSAPRAVDTVL